MIMNIPRNEAAVNRLLSDDDGKVQFHNIEERYLLMIARIADGIEMQNTILKSIDKALRTRK